MGESYQQLDAQTNHIHFEKNSPQIKQFVIRNGNQNVELQKRNQENPKHQEQREHSWNRTTNSTQELLSIAQDENLSRGSYTLANISKLSLPKINRYKNHLETKEEDYKFQWRPPQRKCKLTNQKINNQRNKLQQGRKGQDQLCPISKQILSNSPSQLLLQSEKKLDEKQENSVEYLKERKQTIIPKSYNEKKLDHKVVNHEIKHQLGPFDLEKLQKETDIIEISQDYERNQSSIQIDGEWIEIDRQRYKVSFPFRVESSIQKSLFNIQNSNRNHSCLDKLIEKHHSNFPIIQSWFLDSGQSYQDEDEGQQVDSGQSYYGEDDACKQFKHSLCSIIQGQINQIQRKALNGRQLTGRKVNHRTSIKSEFISAQLQEEQRDETIWILSQLNQRCQNQNDRKQLVKTIPYPQQDGKEQNYQHDNQQLQQTSAQQINYMDLDAFQQQDLSIILQEASMIQSTIGRGAFINGRQQQTPQTQNGIHSILLDFSFINVKKQVLVYNSFNSDKKQENLKRFPDFVVQTQQTVNQVENLMQEDSSDSDNLSSRNSQLIDSFQSWGSNQNSQLNDSSDSVSSQDALEFVPPQLMALNENPIQESPSAYILQQSSLFCYPLAMINQHSNILAQLPDESNLQNVQNLISEQIPMLHEPDQNVGQMQSQKNVIQDENVSGDSYSDQSSSFISKDNSYISISDYFVSLGSSQVSQNSDAVKLPIAQDSDQDLLGKKLSTVQGCDQDPPNNDQDPPDKKWKQK